MLHLVRLAEDVVLTESLTNAIPYMPNPNGPRCDRRDHATLKLFAFSASFHDYPTQRPCHDATPRLSALG